MMGASPSNSKKDTDNKRSAKRDDDSYLSKRIKIDFTGRDVPIQVKKDQDKSEGGDLPLDLNAKSEDHVSICPDDDTKKKKSQMKKSKTDSAIDLIWICTQCREAECAIDPESPLLVCEGPCMRPFHYPCAGLHTVPKEDEKWVCKDCELSRHMCCVCQQYGEDNADVYKCERDECGLYFHEACLNMYDNVSVQILGTHASSTVDCTDESINESIHDVTELPSDTKSVPVVQFSCPAHFCWSCHGGIPPRPDEEQGFVTPDEDETNPITKKTKLQKKNGNKKNTALSAAFQEKKETLLRCLDCPNAYHISCLPPHCQFHELAMLCHEHSQTSNLPYLDINTSMQKDIEQKADNLMKKLKKVKDSDEMKMKMRIKTQTNTENPFLRGMQGDAMTSYDRRIVKLLNESNDGSRWNRDIWGSFCLPVGIQQEVHSKPPVYTQIHSNQYDPKNRPKRHPPSGEFCVCIAKGKGANFICDENCINRIMGVECIARTDTKSGQKNPYANCNHTDDCGNRQLGRRQYVKCKPQREKGKGWGLIAVEGVKRGKLVQEYVGEIVDEETKQRRLNEWSFEHPNDPNFYIMSLESGWYIDARVKGNMSRFINHSCGPNCHLVPLNVNGNFRVGIFALTNIQPGEFLSYDYHFDTLHKDKFVCRCGAANCRGTMKGGANVSDMEDEKKERYREIWNNAKMKFDKDYKFLQDIEKEQITRLNQVGPSIPGEKAVLVSSGPDIGSANKIKQSNVCLWRNVLKGADFESRYARCEAGSKVRFSQKNFTVSNKIDVLSQLQSSKM